jgi:hypothetical protein
MFGGRDEGGEGVRGSTFLRRGRRRFGVAALIVVGAVVFVLVYSVITEERPSDAPAEDRPPRQEVAADDVLTPAGTLPDDSAAAGGNGDEATLEDQRPPGE